MFLTDEKNTTCEITEALLPSITVPVAGFFIFAALN
jgi:hypothetical protein